MQVTFVVREFPPLLPPPRCECCDPTPWEEHAARKRFRELAAAHRLGGAEAVRALGGGELVAAFTEDDFANFPRPDEVANAPLSLCRGCAADHHAEWDERWSEYYSGLL